MLTSEFIKSLKLSEAEKVLLAQTYNGLSVLKSKIEPRVKGEGTELSEAVSHVDIIMGTILSLISKHD